MLQDQISQAIKILKSGGVVVYPTDTAYGLAVDATSLAAIKQLYLLKGRDFNKPVHVIFPSVSWLKRNVVLEKSTLKLMNKFLPGPLTLVVPLKSKSRSLKKIAGPEGLGLRYPDHAMAEELVTRFGKPITTTSANVSGQDTAYSVEQVRKQFEKRKLKPDFYLDSGELKKVKPSTVVLVSNQNAKIIREGPISEKEINKALI